MKEKKTDIHKRKSKKASELDAKKNRIREKII